MPEQYVTRTEFAQLRDDIHRQDTKIEERLAHGAETFHALRTSVAVLEARMSTLTSLPKELSDVTANMSTLGTEISALMQRLDKDDRAEDTRSRWWMDIVTRVILPLAMAFGGYVLANLQHEQTPHAQPTTTQEQNETPAQ